MHCKNLTENLTVILIMCILMLCDECMWDSLLKNQVYLTHLHTTHVNVQTLTLITGATVILTSVETLWV